MVTSHIWAGGLSAQTSPGSMFCWLCNEVKLNPVAPIANFQILESFIEKIFEGEELWGHCASRILNMLSNRVNRV
jgi:hypothetical protein